jgi:hypothetical protein
MAAAAAPALASGDNLIPGADHYVRKLMTSHFFPKIDENGVPYTSTGVGRQAKNQRKSYDTAAKWNAHCRQYFPNGHTHFATNPFNRAMAAQDGKRSG